MLVKEAMKLSESMATLHFDTWFMKVNNNISSMLEGCICVGPVSQQYVVNLELILANECVTVSCNSRTVTCGMTGRENGQKYAEVL